MTSFAPSGTRLVEHLGVGSVFEVAIVRSGAEQELVCKRVAPRARLAAGESALDREQAILVAARSDHLARAVSWGSDERGGFLLETRAAGGAVRRLIDEPRPVGAAAFIELARASSEALASLHALRDAKGNLSVVHGDISPDNLFFAEPSTITFIDLSSATFRDAPAPVFPRDRGTLPYVAPELARGEIAASAATDTYALAATLLAIALGRSIVGTNTEASRLLEVATQGIDMNLVDQRTDLPSPARRALAQALAFDPAARLTSSRELARAFQTQVG